MGKMMEQILFDIRRIIEEARGRIARSINHERTVGYWLIGERIFIEEQGSKERADYGKYLLKNLSKVLVNEFGDGFSRRQLELMRQFYLTFPIANAVSSQLTWTHYKTLIRIDDPDKRAFFIAESIKNAWNVRQMERQIHSLLYERLLMSQDKDTILAIAQGEQQPFDPSQIIKDPTILEFLGLKPDATYYESEIEQAIITHLHDFLLELGNGFSFVARQKRIVIEGDEFKIDLVFYNRLLQCFVLFDIKVDKITHQDLGQLQMYVNYYDRDIKTDFEHPTIGVLLCADKNDAVVRYSLPLDNQQIFASQYQLHLPSEAQLLAEVRKELARFKELKG
jgi:predicted nuclease of restriction endonuclease-like (RecB) superfamily